MPPVLHLSDDQLDQVFRAARPLHVRDRDAFLQAVADSLRGKVMGDGEVFRAVREAQRRFYEAPELDSASRHRSGIGKYR
jgi:hypothetical protein